MLPDSRSAEPPGAVTYALAGALCLFAPIAGFLAANRYPLLAAEALPLHLAAIGGGVVVGILAKLRRDWLALAALWACVFLAIAFLYDVETIRSVAFVALAVAVGIAVLKRHAATVVMVAATLHVATTLGLGLLDRPPAANTSSDSAAGARPPARELPPVVHLVLDEFAGLRGMPAEVPGVAATASRLAEHFVASGFELHSHAYSQYADTTNSLPNLLNFASSTAVDAFVAGGGDAFAMRANKYFEHLSRLGYTLSVYQSDYLDYCATPGVTVKRCSTYRSNSLASIKDVSLSVAQKARFVANSFLDSSAFLRKVRLAYFLAGEKLGVEVPEWPTGNSRTGPLAVMDTIAELKAALGKLRPGQAHFAHLMLPHYPYILRADCTVKPDIRTWLNTAPFERTNRPGPRNGSASRAERYEQYAGQVDCTRTLLDGLFAAVRASGQWQQAIIIVHGDHGSRIMRNVPTTANRRVLVDDDFRDSFSAFFAAKRPSSTGRVDASIRPLQTLLADLWQVSAPEAGSHRVYLLPSHGGDLVPVPLQGFGPPAPTEAPVDRK